MNLRVKIFLALLFCLQSFCGLAQKKQRCDMDSAETFIISYGDQKKMNLPSLMESTDSFYSRYLTDNCVVDIWSKNGVSFEGAIVMYIASYEPYNEKKRSQKPSKLFFNKGILDTATAKKVFDETLKIAAIPTDDSINHGLIMDDGFFYVVQTASPSAVCKKHYSYYYGNDTTGTKQGVMNAFVRNLDTILDLKERDRRFIDSLKPGTYHRGMVGFTKFSPKVLAEIKKNEPYVAYLDSLKGTLNAYLIDTLTRIFAVGPPVDCSYKTFFLHFTTKNKLSKITHYKQPYDKEDRKEYRKCDRQLKEIFKKIEINFVHAQIPYWKKLEFDDGKVIVGD